MSAQSVVDGLYLFNHSPDHRIYTLVEFNHFLVFPVIHQKVRFFYEDGKPIGLVTWCWLTEQEADEFLAERFMPDEEHYRRPDTTQDQYQLWGIEFIAPFGHARSVMRAMRDYQKQHRKKTEKVRWRRLKSPDTEIRRTF